MVFFKIFARHFLRVILILVLVFFYWRPKIVLAVSPKKGVGGEYNSAFSQLNISWFYNWQHYSENSFRQGIEFIPMIRVGRDEGGRCQGPWRYPDFSHYESLIRETAQNHPGSYWLVGNEPEIADQDGIQENCALERYKEAMVLVRSLDSAAKFIVGGFHLNPTRPTVNDYGLSSLKNEPGFRGWHFHLYLDSRRELSVSLNDFRQMLVSLVSWSQNQGGGEIWITEFLECFWGGSRELNADRIAQLMPRTVSFLEENQKITRYAWFLFSDPRGYSWPFTLVNGEKTQLKNLGQIYARLAVESDCHCPAGAGQPAKNQGNANCDQVIDLVDFEFWREEFLGTRLSKNGDFNCDKTVSLVDFEFWRRNRQ